MDIMHMHRGRICMPQSQLISLLHHHVTKKRKFRHNVAELAHTTWSVHTVVLGMMHDSAARIRRTCVFELHVLE